MGDTKTDEKTRGDAYRLFVTSKPVERLSKSEIETIRDPVVRTIVARHVAERGGDPKKAFPPFPRLPARNGGEGPEIRRARVLVKQQLNLMVKAGTGYADAAANHHMSIWQNSDGSTDYDAVSLHNAARRLSRREPVIQRVRGDGWHFMMSLAGGEAIEFPDEEKKGIWIIQSIWSNGQIVLVRHTDARPTTKKEADRLRVGGVREEFLPTCSGLLKRKARKVSVDPIGRVRPARD
jgi:CRISPR-associated endonuclease Csn1